MKLEDRLKRYLHKTPKIHDTAWVAPGADVMGDVTMGRDSSVWYQAVLRGDINSIVIGEGSNVQDGSVIHLADEYGVNVGNLVTIGHGAILHACEVGDECLIGMRATILDGAVIGRNCIIGAHTLVPKGMVVPDGSLVLGTPGKIIRGLSLEEQRSIAGWALKYIPLAKAHKELIKSKS